MCVASICLHTKTHQPTTKSLSSPLTPPLFEFIRRKTARSFKTSRCRSGLSSSQSRSAAAANKKHQQARILQKMHRLLFCSKKSTDRRSRKQQQMPKPLRLRRHRHRHPLQKRSSSSNNKHSCKNSLTSSLTPRRMESSSKSPSTSTT